ncbi:MAG: helix-turn-helix transcriptional regulator [Sandaracinaceae bacterium]|nr:helix-turn-helix transcriptional regulator [Sandaracinaceae bacterium]
MRARTPLDIGLTVRERRRELGLNQAELAAKVGVSRQWLVAVENGKPGAELGLVLRLLNVLGVDVWLGELPAAQDGPPPIVMDLDRVIARARGSLDEE